MKHLDAENVRVLILSAGKIDNELEKIFGKIMKMKKEDKNNEKKLALVMCQNILCIKFKMLIFCN